MEANKRKIFHSRPIFYGFLALFLSIIVARFLFAQNLTYIICVCLIFAGLFVYAICFKRFFTFFLVSLVFLFGLGWFSLGQALFQGVSYSESCQIVGRVSDDIDFHQTNADVVFKDVFINGKKIDKNILLTIKNANSTNIECGDVLSFEAELENTKMFSLGSFDSSNYRTNCAYKSSVNIADATKLGNKKTIDENFRLKIKNTLYANMGEESGSIAFAVLFGNKNDIETETKDYYKAAGIIHLLTVSGLHVSFLILLIGFVLKRLKTNRFLNFFICLTFLILYAWLCGWTPSVMRAGIMGLVLLFSHISGKWYDNLNSLGLAGIIITLIFPLSPLDVGFEMSFFCVLGIVVIYPWLSKLLKKIFPKFVAESFAISIAAQLGTIPFLAKTFSLANLFSFFVNLLVIPLFSVLYPLLFVSSLVVALLPFMGFLLRVCGWGFDFVTLCAKCFAVVGPKLYLKPLSIFVSTIFFMGLFFLGRNFMSSKKVRAIACAVVFLLGGTIFLIDSYAILPTQCFSVCYESTSSGRPLLISKGGQVACVDLESEFYIERYLYQNNVNHIDYLFVLNDNTVDIELARKYGVKNIFYFGSGEGFDEEILISDGTNHVVGDFKFCYIFIQNESGKKLYGISIEFNDTKTFVLKNRAFVESDIEAVSNLFQNFEFDIALVGNKEDYARVLNAEYVIGYKEKTNIDYSYQKSGNCAIIFKGNNKKVRCID